MLLILVLSIDPFVVHLADVGLILVAQLVHSADEIVPLIGQVLQLLVEGDLVLPVLDLFAAQVLQFRLKVSNPTPSRLVISLQPLQIVRLANQV